mgnify:CR=1 FL=1
MVRVRISVMKMLEMSMVFKLVRVMILRLIRVIYIVWLACPWTITARKEHNEFS